MTIRTRTEAGSAGAAALVLAAVLSLAACGGSGGDDAPAPPPPAGPTVAERSAAASATAESGANACSPVRPFYWEVGDGAARLGGGTVAGSSDPAVWTADTVTSIASASKWLYGGYVVEKRAGALTADDVRFLTFASGYTKFLICLPGQTVQQCVDFASNGEYVAAADGKFAYGGGHMQKHAALEGLGPLDNAGLAAEVQSRIGSDVGLAYSQPQPAGGGVSSAADYARYLRKVLRGELKMRDALGTHAACTNPGTCPSALNAPVPSSESWHYSIGHWVEDDPVVGDGAFSSPGAFGFYPWIDAGKTLYGVLARRSDTGGGVDSVSCGRLIRKAWATATPQ